MLEKIKKGWELVKRSLNVLKEDKEILLFPIVAAILVSILFVSVVLSSWFFILPNTNEQTLQPTAIAITLILLTLVYFINTFFKSAIISSATIRLSGANPTFSDGFKAPSKKIGKIFVWSIILLLVNLAISAMKRSRNKKQSAFVAASRRMAARAAETAWKFLTYFVIPIILFEDSKLWDATKKSTLLFKKTWGESITAQFSVGFIFVLMGLVTIIPCGLLIWTGIPTLIFIGTLLAMISIGVISLIKISVDGILVASLYYYATKNKIPKVFEGTNPQELFMKK